MELVQEETAHFLRRRKTGRNKEKKDERKGEGRQKEK